MALDDFRLTDLIDYTDFCEQAAVSFDRRVLNDKWRENRKQQYYVAQTVERTIAMERPVRLPQRRARAQNELADEGEIELQSVQRACHKDMFESFVWYPPTDYRGRPQWHMLFDEVVRDIEREQELDRDEEQDEDQ